MLKACLHEEVYSIPEGNWVSMWLEMWLCGARTPHHATLAPVLEPYAFSCPVAKRAVVQVLVCAGLYVVARELFSFLVNVPISTHTASRVI